MLSVGIRNDQGTPPEHYNVRYYVLQAKNWPRAMAAFELELVSGFHCDLVFKS
jgi:hypothetical protein